MFKWKNVFAILMIIVGARSFEKEIMPEVTAEFLIFFAIFLIGLYILVKDEIAFHKNKKRTK